MIIKFKKAKLKSIFLISLFIIMMATIGYAMTVTLNAPPSGSWWTSSDSVDHNFTVLINEGETIDWCSVNSNRTGTWKSIANTTFGEVTNGTPFVTGIAWSDTNSTAKYWNVTCFNGTNPIESSSVFTLGVDSNPPTITLDEVDDDSFQSTSTFDLKYTPTDSSNPETCLFYTNVTSTWAINQTNTSYVSGVQIIVNLSSNANATISDGNYIWNAICNDSASNSVWAEDTNRTFTVDTVSPIDIDFVTTNNTFSTNTTPLIKWNQTTEINFDEYEVLVSTNLSSFDSHIIQTKSVSGITNNATVLSELATNTQYYMKVRAVDLAGNVKNTTNILWLVIDSNIPIVTLITPANNTFTSDTTPDINVTVVDDNPDNCDLFISNSSGTGGFTINKSKSGITNGTITNLTAITLAEGTYKFYVECNDSIGTRVNATTSPFDLIIDTTSPTDISLNSTWHQKNSTDGTPILSWNITTETNFERYFIEAINISDGNVDFSANVTTLGITNLELNLTFSQTYNFSVTAFDLAGNSIKTTNTTDSWTYVDDVCADLQAGWNLCGTTWTSAKNLSVVGEETSATFVTVWNESHEWSTCIVGVSDTNCDIDTGIGGSLLGHIWVYVASNTLWEEGRTWVATQLDANITLGNNTNGWNIIPGEFRNGRSFWQLGNDDFTSVNVSMFSLPYLNGSVVSFVNKPLFNARVENTTVLEYGKAMWTFYNGTGTTTFDVGSW